MYQDFGAITMAFADREKMLEPGFSNYFALLFRHIFVFYILDIRSIFLKARMCVEDCGAIQPHQLH
jgi:hypothetical protein